MNSRTAAVITVIAVLVIAGIAYAAISQQYRPTTPPAASGTAPFVVALADPPSVPPGTSALWLN
ncbi:MAG: hypothetical protein ACP5GS_08530, partial [Nitrososphaeria archaeon]